MKKLFLLGSIIFISTFSLAQNTAVGPTAGSGISWISKTGQQTSPAPSLNIGISVTHFTKEHLGFSGDVIYSTEGVNYKGELGNLTTKTTYNSEYIRVPLRVTYYLYDFKSKIRPNVSIGPSFGFLTGGKVFTDVSNGQVLRDYVKNEAKPFDFGIQGSAGIMFALGESLWINPYISYYQGLTQQNKDGDDKLKNGNAMLNLSILFGLNRKFKQ